MSSVCLLNTKQISEDKKIHAPKVSFCLFHLLLHINKQKLKIIISIRLDPKVKNKHYGIKNRGFFVKTKTERQQV